MIEPGQVMRDLVRTLAEALGNPESTITRVQAHVTAVIVGPPKRVTLKLHLTDAVSFNSAYLKSYTPAVNDVVWVDLNGPDPLVIGIQA